jgi:hypothetical protein
MNLNLEKVDEDVRERGSEGERERGRYMFGYLIIKDYNINHLLIAYFHIKSKLL